MSLPLIAIVGAPNVGKSTLFNRLVGRRRAIVTREAGMTRDRLYARVDADRPFRIVDTGGMTPRMAAPFAEEIEQQAAVAMAESALIVFVVDARAGLTALDRDLAEMLRRSGRPTLVVANKVDSEKLEQAVHEMHALGLGAPVPISAEHGRGIVEMLDVVLARLDEVAPASAQADEDPAELRIAIVGRPNVGKSSLVNRMVGEQRVVVSDIPGTTRDAIDTLLTLDDRRYRLIDTAGLRRPGRIREAKEKFSVLRARENIEACDVAILVLDASESLAAQDTHVAGYVIEAYRPLVVAVNKWDLLDMRELAAKDWEDRIRRRLRFAKQVPLVFISALTGQRVMRLLELADTAHRDAGVRVPTTRLNRWLEGQSGGNPLAPPPANQLRLFYSTQTGTHPPRFVIFCNDPRRVHFSFRRRLENSLRATFGFGASPIRLDFRGRRRAPER